jgi:drug/metabolite transporter (DMT)-like permease
MFVVLTPLFGALLGKERILRTAWLAALLSAVGLFLLAGGGSEINLSGDALVLSCAVSFAFHILVTADAVGKHPLGALLTVQLGTCGIVSLLVGAVTGGLELPHSGSVWVALAMTAFVASALGFFVQTYAQRYSAPARTALILASEPAFAGLFAYLLDDEVLSALSWLGAGLILVAIIGTELAPYARRSRLPEGSVASATAQEETGSVASATAQEETGSVVGKTSSLS